MREEDSNWFAKWEEELPKPEELMPLSQTLITPDLAIAFDIPNPTSPNPQSKQQQTPHVQSSQPNSSAEFESTELNGGGGGDEPARTLKRPRLVWTPQLHKRFVDAVAHLGIKNAVPKTIMQLMSVDGLTRENVASHLQKYRLYLKRMQGLSNSGSGGSNAQSLSGAGVDPAMDNLFAVKGDTTPPPILSFASCKLPQKLLENIEVAGYEMPTPVQMQAIPAALARQSLLVSAETGSGKTGSFLIPIVSQCAKFNEEHFRNQQQPLAMVLTPTRELCIQVEDQAKVLGKGLPFKTALVVGGDAMAGQLHRIQQGVSLIVGTPGRLIDLLTKHEIELDTISILVLDEVDCMLQRGFREQVMQIFTALSQPQVLMYSATIPKDVEKMASSMAKKVTVISVGKPNKPNQSVKQLAIWVDSKRKKQKLFDILMSKQHYKPPVIVFVDSRLGADLLSEAITVSTGLKALSIHGEKSMKDRREIVRSFLVGEIPVIVATGVLSRGIDLLTVKQVIVFDMPNSIKEYVHQVGRASRMGEEGTSIVFVNEENKKLFPQLVEALKTSGAAIPRELANSRYSVGSFSAGRGQKKRKLGF